MSTFDILAVRRIHAAAEAPAPAALQLQLLQHVIDIVRSMHMRTRAREHAHARGGRHG